MSMTQEEYLARNAKGFEGDEFIAVEIQKLIEKFKVKTIIETGTYLGATTKRFSVMAEEVHTVELIQQNHDYAKDNLMGFHNAFFYIGSSEDVLSRIVPPIKGRSLLFFLDAHFYDFCPLIEELKVIADNGIKPVIVIHDWKVDNRPELGYDSYNGQDFTFDWIQQHVESIYGVNGYEYHFNGKSEGAQRGVIYIYPKQND